MFLWIYENLKLLLLEFPMIPSNWLDCFEYLRDKKLLLSSTDV